MARILFGAMFSACVTAAFAGETCGLSLVQQNAKKLELQHWNQSLVEAAAGNCVSCVIWGDAHVESFDVTHKRLAKHPHREAFFRSTGWKEDQFTVEEEGTFWLVINEHVHIQGRYWKNKTNPEFMDLGALAIGGPFLDGNLMVIHTSNGDIQWNKKAILSQVPSRFENKLISAKYSRNSELVKNGAKGVGLEIDFPKGVSLTVNRWKQSLAAKIKICGSLHSQPQLGQCGNKHGNPNGDSELVLLGNGYDSVNDYWRKLSQDEIMFPDSEKKRTTAPQANFFVPEFEAESLERDSETTSETTSETDMDSKDLFELQARGTNKNGIGTP